MFRTTLLVLSCALGLGTQCSAKDKEVKEDSRITICDGKDVWELTKDGLKKLPKIEEKSVRRKGSVETGPRFKCKYCPKKFFTHSAWYWHNKNNHSYDFYHENMK